MKAKKTKLLGVEWRQALVITLFAFGFVFGPIFVMGWWSDNTCSEYATILKVKDVSAGTAFSSDVCIYETDKGDITHNYCYYDTGDRIKISTRMC